MSGGTVDAFYACFWLLPRGALAVPETISSALAPIPDDVLQRRAELYQHCVAGTNEVGLNDPQRARDAIASCDRYVVALRAAGIGFEAQGETTWRSAFTAEPVTIPLAFEEPMALTLQSTLLLRQGAELARARSPECIPLSAQCFSRAAGLLDYVLALEEDISTERREDVPVQMPDLAPRVLHAMVDLTLAMAQQLAVVKATLHFDAPYSKSVLQKLHTACHLSFESFELAVAQSCYRARPVRDSTSLFGFATVYSHLHRALVLQLEAEIELGAGRVGEAIAYAGAARRQLQERQSMRDVGLPPLQDEIKEVVGPCIPPKIEFLSGLYEAWTRDNESVYFATVPSEQEVLATVFPHVFLLKAVPFDPNAAFLAATPSSGGFGGSGADRGGRAGPSVSDLVLMSLPPENQLVTAVKPTRGSTPPPDANDDDSSDGSKPSSESDEADAAPVGAANAATKTTAMRSPKPTTAIDPSLLAAFKSSPPPLIASRAARAIHPRADPPMPTTSRRMLAEVKSAPSGSLARRLSTNEEVLKTAVTEVTIEKMKRALQSGLIVYRQAKENKWKKETLRVRDDHLVFLRKQAFALLTKQTKMPWSTIHAFQHELQPLSELLAQLAPHGQKLTSVLAIAGAGDKVLPMEFTLASAEENACAVACLQRILREKKLQRQ